MAWTCYALIPLALTLVVPAMVLPSLNDFGINRLDFSVFLASTTASPSQLHSQFPTNLLIPPNPLLRMSPPPSVSPSAAASQEEVTNQTLMSVIMDLRAQLTSISRRQDEMMQLILNVRCEVETRTEP